MKTILFLLTSALLLGCRNDNTQPDHAAIKAEIERILEIQEAAYGDKSPEARQRTAATCSDSLVFIGGDDGGIVKTAAEYVADLADGYITKPHDRFFRIYNNTVIVSSLHQGFKLLSGDTLLINSRTTKIFAKEGSEWKMVYFTYAPLPILYNATTKADPKKLADYTGVYSLEPNVADTITVSDGKLYSKITGTEKSELAAINDSTFIGEGYFGKAVFSRNRSGKVTHYYFEWNDGQRIVFPKVK